MGIKKIFIMTAGLFFACLILYNPVMALVSFAIIAAIYGCITMKVEHCLAFFILLYPVLPFHVGVDLGSNLPVIRLHRLLLLFLMLCWLSKKPISTTLKSLFKFPLTYLLWVAIPIYLISYLARLNFKGWVFFMGNFFLENFMIAFIFYDVLKEKTMREMKQVLLCIAVSVLAPFFLGAIEYESGFNIFSKIEPYREVLKEAFPLQTRLGVVRIRGPFVHSISYGLFFAMAVPSGLLLFALKRHIAHRRSIMLGIFLLICFIGSYLSLSRIAVLTFFTNSLILLGFSNIFIAVIFSTLIFFIFAQPFSIYGMKERIALLAGGILGGGYQTGEMTSSAYQRIEQITVNWNAILNAPFLGMGGLGPIGLIDSNYFLIMVNSGILGLIAYLSFFILPLVLSFKMFVSATNKLYRNIGFYTIIIIVNTFLIFSVLSLTDYLYLIWIYIGIFMACHVLYRRENSQLFRDGICA